MDKRQILISGKPTGRLASKIHDRLVGDGHKVSFCTDIFDYSKIDLLDNADIFISTAWNTKGNYKEDPINEKYAKTTIDWLEKCQEKDCT